MCVTTDVLIEGNVIKSFTARSYKMAEQAAKRFIENNNLKNAYFMSEDTTDKYEMED